MEDINIEIFKIKKIIYESFKPEDNFMVDLEKSSYTDTLGFYDLEDQRTIFKFY